MRVSLNGQAEGACKTEISELDLRAIGRDEEVLRLQISVENSVLVQVDESLEDLVQETLRLLLR